MCSPTTMCPHAMHVSSYYYICVLILLYMCPHITVCVLIFLYMCPHITMYVSSYYSRICVSSYYSRVARSYTPLLSSYICVLMLLRTTRIHSCMCPQARHRVCDARDQQRSAEVSRGGDLCGPLLTSQQSRGQQRSAWEGTSANLC